jgi:18S rRNA (guanine1575-N7)-methyltransferase
MSRPETSNPPELFYNDTEAAKYHGSSRMIKIQEEIAERALEMLNLPEKQCYLLDIGCGSGLSGQVLEEAGHIWVGCDISNSMLAIAKEGETETGDIIRSDMGQGLPFKPATFDGIISISALQWLCYSNSSEEDPKLRLNRFFSSLYYVLKRNARAVLQFYPETPEQALLIAQCASRVGFAGGIVVDYPNSSKAKKHYLCLSFDRAYSLPTPREQHSLVTSTRGGGEEEEEGEDNEATGGITERSQRAAINVLGRHSKGDHRNNNNNNHNGHHSKTYKKAHGKGKKSLEWIMHKKDRYRAQGKDVKNDSKYSGRKRSGGHF